MTILRSTVFAVAMLALLLFVLSSCQSETHQCKVYRIKDGAAITCPHQDTVVVPDGKAGQDGQNGLDGRDGINGADGRDGVDGRDGANGVNGVDGVNGIDGADGRDGIDGLNGIDGQNGQDGQDGADGKNGKDAVGVYVGSLCDSAILQLGDGYYVVNGVLRKLELDKKVRIGRHCSLLQDAPGHILEIRK